MLTQRGPFPAQSCLALTMCRVSCQSVNIDNLFIVSAEVATPFQKMHTVWLRLLQMETKCLACTIQTGKFLS